MSEQQKRAKLAATLEMGEDFASDALLIFVRRITRELRSVLDERFLRVGGFAMNEADEADQLIPGPAMRVSVFAGVNGGKLPLIFSGKRLDGMSQAGGERFQLVGWARRRSGLPEIGTQIEILHTEAIALADGGLEVFGPRQIMELGEMA